MTLRRYSIQAFESKEKLTPDIRSGGDDVACPVYITDDE